MQKTNNVSLPLLVSALPVPFSRCDDKRPPVEETASSAEDQHRFSASFSMLVSALPALFSTPTRDDHDRPSLSYRKMRQQSSSHDDGAFLQTMGPSTSGRCAGGDGFPQQQLDWSAPYIHPNRRNIPASPRSPNLPTPFLLPPSPRGYGFNK